MFVRNRGHRIIDYKSSYYLGKYYLREQKLEKALDAFMVSAKSGEYYGRLYSDLSMYHAGELAFNARKMDEAEFYLKQFTETWGKLRGKAYNLLALISLRKGDSIMA